MSTAGLLCLLKEVSTIEVTRWRTKEFDPTDYTIAAACRPPALEISVVRSAVCIVGARRCHLPSVASVCADLNQRI